MRLALVSLVLASAPAACGRPSAASTATDAGAPSRTAPPPAATASAKETASGVACTPDEAFPATFEVPEASAASEVELRPGVRELLVVSDSGEHGAALAYALPDGPPRRLRLPLDEGV